MLGGCSSINGMIYMRGQARDYDQWRQLGNAGWAWDDVLPYFKRSRGSHARAPTRCTARAASGGSRRCGSRWEILDAFRDAAAEVGIPNTDDFNRGNNEGCGYFQVNQRRGVRWNTAKAFLRPVRERPNLHVVTGAQAQRVRLDGKRAAGVEYLHDGEPASPRRRAR